MTTAAGPDLAGIHDRMPVIIEPADRNRWLDHDIQDLATVADLLKPSPKGNLVRHPVSTEVNSTRNDRPELVAPDPAVDTDLFLVNGGIDTTEGRSPEKALSTKGSSGSRRPVAG